MVVSVRELGGPSVCPMADRLLRMTVTSFVRSKFGFAFCLLVGRSAREGTELDTLVGVLFPSGPILSFRLSVFVLGVLESFILV